MNIHSEYCFLPEGASLPDDSKKVLGIHSEGFYFLIHRGSEILYALLGSFRNGVTEDALWAVVNRKPEFRLAEIERLLLMPEIFVAVPNDVLLGRNEKELFEMVSVLPDSFQIMKTSLNASDTSLLSAFPETTLNALRQLHKDTTAIDMAAEWLNKIPSSGDKAAAHAIIFPSKFSLSVTVNNKLLLVNSFSYRDKNDFLYFVLGAIKACNLDPMTTEISLCGEISPSSPLAEALSAYFPSVLYDAVPCNGDAEARVLSSMLFPLF